MKQRFISLFKALIPALDRDRHEWRIEMEQQLQSSRRQNLIEAELLRSYRNRTP